MQKNNDEILQTVKTILETLRKVQQRQDDMDMDMEKDRQSLQNLNIRLSNMESQIEELRKAVNQSSERTKNKVADVVAPVIESADRLSTEINDKKMVILKQTTQNIFTRISKLWRH